MALLEFGLHLPPPAEKVEDNAFPFGNGLWQAVHRRVCVPTWLLPARRGKRSAYRRKISGAPYCDATDVPIGEIKAYRGGARLRALDFT